MISPVNFALIIGGIGTFAVLIFCFCSPYSPQKCKGESSHTLCSCFMICLIKPSEKCGSKSHIGLLLSAQHKYAKSRGTQSYRDWKINSRNECWCEMLHSLSSAISN